VRPGKRLGAITGRTFDFGRIEEEEGERAPSGRGRSPRNIAGNFWASYGSSVGFKLYPKLYATAKEAVARENGVRHPRLPARTCVRALAAHRLRSSASFSGRAARQLEYRTA
jgi:hypothetical protein